MTTEEGGTVLEKSEALINRIRVIRSVCRNGSGQAYARIDFFLERTRLGQALPPMDEDYLRRKIPRIGSDRILSISENTELNVAADRIFSYLRGRTDDQNALQEIWNLIDLSRRLGRK